MGTARPGGRTARTGAAVFDATLVELVEHGYEQTSVEAIALRAGVHKTTIYRRWGTKEQLVAAALEASAASRIEVPDTGDIDADLRTLARSVVTMLTSRDGLATVRTVVSGAPVSSELATILGHFWAARLAHVGPIVERAVRGRQLPKGTSAAELMKYVAAPLYYQLLLTSEPLTKASADRSAAAALAAARAGVLTSARRRAQTATSVDRREVKKTRA